MKRSLLALLIVVAGCNSSVSPPTPAARTAQPQTTAPVQTTPFVTSAVPSSPPSTAAPATPGPSASSPTSVVLGEAGSPIFPATYSSRFAPAFSFTVAPSVAAQDCSPGYTCRGEVNVNDPSFLDIEFGSVLGAEFMAAPLDTVYDPKAMTKVIAVPDDFAAWVSALPGLAVVTPAQHVSIGGLEATQIDVQPHASTDGLAFSPTFGIANHATRLVELKVGQHHVLLTEQGPDFATAVALLQPLLDSVVWQPGATTMVAPADGG